MPKRPNVIVFMADQMTPLCLPFYGHPVVRAPHLSELAAEGVVFDSAYCNSPLCAPSRAAFMSGRLPSRIGAYDNIRVLRRGSRPLRMRSPARLSHDPVGQDALLRRRPAARVRGAADYRHLPVRLRLDAELASASRAPGMVPQHEFGPRRRAVRAHEPARLRRRGRVRGGAQALRYCPGSGRETLLHGGLDDPSP